MDAQIRRLALVFLLLFGVLALNLNYLQVIAASDLANHPANKRLLLQEYRIDRGEILASDRRTVLAESRPTRGQLKYLRRYPGRSLYAHITGFYSFVFGRSELEQSYNRYLAGHAEELFPQRFVDQILGRDPRGASLVLTIDPVLQRAAQQGLAGRAGAVAAINPQTGEVLALVANPSYDPNALSSHDGGAIRSAWRQLNADPDKPLVSVASDDFFPPGSTFKIVTAAAALENGDRPNTTYPNPPVLDLPQTTADLENFGGDHCLGGASRISLADALMVSCNVAFAQIGLKLGAEKLVEQANRFGFSRDIPFDIPFQSGAIPDVEAFEQDLPAVAQSAIGQRDVATNVLHLALVAGAVGNRGVLMEPQLVGQIRDPSGRVIRGLEPRVWDRAMSEGNARILAQLMQRVVDSGTGTAAQIPGVAVAGKTGTAQQAEGEPPHAWFVGFAPAGRPTIAVAVVILNGGDLGSEATGGALSAPIARAVMEAALRGGA
ncbi:MAG: peptidoglycan D,D-transpeptidase FtsI family protein [Actinomycetota bacterium]